MTSRMFKLLFGAFALLLLQLPAGAGVIKHVFVVAMENTDAKDIYGNTSEAPYINNVLMPQAARSSNFIDILPQDVPSQGHYMIMEAGTNKFSDKTFTDSSDPSASYSTGSRDHLAAQMKATVAPNKVTWMSYQQSLSSYTGACPIKSDYPYAPRHNPFVYFRDISGYPPSKTNSYCAAHHKDYTALAADLANNRIANYVFITPDLCHDMHDKCGSASRIRSGDDWLKSALPPLIAWANANSGVVFVLWDEGSSTNEIAFFAVGPGVKKNFVSDLKLTHRSLVKSVETIFGLPILPAVATERTFKSLFKAGQFP